MRATKPSQISAPSPLREALFWTYLRQEISAAFNKQRPIHIDLEGPMFQLSVSRTADVAWGNRIILLCARVIQWAFGKNAPFEEWNELHEAIVRWEQDRPEEFEAIFYQSEDATMGRFFPDIWFSDDEHGTSLLPTHLKKDCLFNPIKLQAAFTFIWQNWCSQCTIQPSQR